jgi:hypothetical protein
VGATPARQQFGQLIGASFACWAAQRQAGLRPIEGLDPGLLVHAQDQRVLR